MENKKLTYGYDANGERVYKLIGTNTTSQLNSANPYAEVFFDDAVLYPNPYIVISQTGYTKHYYAGTERLATVIGGGGFGDMESPIDKPTQREQEIVYAFDKQYQQSDPFLQGTVMSYPVPTEDIEGEQRGELEYLCQPTFLDYVDIPPMKDFLLGSIKQYTQANGPDKDVYFTHSDHLGSANWITDGLGKPIQYIHYAPYGELIENQHIGSWYDERYKFTGKERDWETGYDYFGARYYASGNLSLLSVDPLADKYPNISPYAYAAWNPVKYVDPDGQDTLHFDAKGNYTHRVQSEGSHVGLWHKSNNSTREFRFQDPNDANRFMTDEEYLDNISNGGTLDRLDGIMPVSLSSVYKATRPSISDRLKGRYIAALSGKANGSMDYMRLNEPNYNMAGSQSYLMLVDGIPLAQQPYNMGNMLWGLKMHRLGFSLPACLLGAHAYTIYGGMTGKYPKIELDSFDDQCSIILGYMLWPGL